MTISPVAFTGTTLIRLPHRMTGVLDISEALTNPITDEERILTDRFHHLTGQKGVTRTHLPSGRSYVRGIDIINTGEGVTPEDQQLRDLFSKVSAHYQNPFHNAYLDYFQNALDKEGVQALLDARRQDPEHRPAIAPHANILDTDRFIVRDIHKLHLMHLLDLWQQKIDERKVNISGVNILPNQKPMTLGLTLDIDGETYQCEMTPIGNDLVFRVQSDIGFREGIYFMLDRYIHPHETLVDYLSDGERSVFVDYPNRFQDNEVTEKARPVFEALKDLIRHQAGPLLK